MIDEALPQQIADITQGDHITAGNISNSKGIAIGRGAQVYNYEFQVNLPPELIRHILTASEQSQGEDYSQPALAHEIWEPETLLIPAGDFLMGSEIGDGIPEWETPQFTMYLPAYRIGKYPVTNGQFARFVQQTGRFDVTKFGWQNYNQPSPGQSSLPVMGVTWYEALDYCVWLIQETGRPYTLPSEAQWEKAARGSKGQIFPWSDEWQAGPHCNQDCTAVTPVESFNDSASPFGVVDMVGNVREWTTTLWGRHRRFSLAAGAKYPWQLAWKPNEGVDELNVNRQIRRVTRGGAALTSDIPLRAARRESELPYKCGLTNGRIGFRVALNWEDKHGDS